MTGIQTSDTNPLMGGLLDRYPRGPAYDEMFGADGLPHPHTRALYDALQTLTGDDLARRAEARDRSFRDQGVVFSHAGEEWVFPLDLIPRLIPAAEWELVEAGRHTPRRHGRRRRPG